MALCRLAALGACRAHAFHGRALRAERAEATLWASGHLRLALVVAGRAVVARDPCFNVESPRATRLAAKEPQGLGDQ